VSRGWDTIQLLHILSMTYNLTLVYNMQMKLVPMTVNRSSTASLSNSQGGSLDSVAVPSFCARFRPLWFNCTCLKVAPCQWERCDHAGAYLRLSVFRSPSVWPRVSPQVSIRCLSYIFDTPSSPGSACLCKVDLLQNFKKDRTLYTEIRQRWEEAEARGRNTGSFLVD